MKKVITFALASMMLLSFVVTPMFASAAFVAAGQNRFVAANQNGIVAAGPNGAVAYQWGAPQAYVWTPCSCGWFMVPVPGGGCGW